MRENPYTTPQTAPEEITPSGNTSVRPLASRWSRLGASVIDTIIMLVVYVPIQLFVFATGILPGLASSDKGLANIQLNGESLVGFIFSFMLSLVVFFTINGYLLVKAGQSIGKKALGIQIVDRQTQQLLPPSRVLGMRYVITTLLAHSPVIGQYLTLIDTLFIFGREKRCIHDMLANSIVVEI